MKKILLFLLLGSALFCSKNGTDAKDQLTTNFFSTEDNLKVSDFPYVPKDEHKVDKVEKKESTKSNRVSETYSVALYYENGIVYKKSSKKPYTGKLSYYRDGKLSIICRYTSGILQESTFYDNGTIVANFKRPSN